jgi:hypothetical protein
VPAAVQETWPEPPSAPAPWEVYWSDEDDAYWFYNAVTEECTFDLSTPCFYGRFRAVCRADGSWAYEDARTGEEDPRLLPKCPPGWILIWEVSAREWA